MKVVKEKTTKYENFIALRVDRLHHLSDLWLGRVDHLRRGARPGPGARSATRFTDAQVLGQTDQVVQQILDTLEGTSSPKSGFDDFGEEAG